MLHILLTEISVSSIRSQVSLFLTTFQATTMVAFNDNFPCIPVVDLSQNSASSLIVEACESFGFFQVKNHDISTDIITTLEAKAFAFFELPQSAKEKDVPRPFCYNTNSIGRRGDTGCLEYLLTSVSNSDNIHSNDFLTLANIYISPIRKMACQILELMADGLKLEPRNVLSRLLSDDKSDSRFRINYYPPCAGMELGFGEHTDPQIISVLRSNAASGLQILKDGIWIPVPPDPSSFYINVDDCLQVMTNGRFKSVKHKVILSENWKQRLSMIYFGGPPLSAKIAPISSLMKDEEESPYKEFTWSEFTTSVANTRLDFDRLSPFLKSPN
ncbi:Gibberellin 2-beta-dioxygenase [Heracleum sosnowskyi]|uniref:Gibberellin 2-beta-dioxygenase n=1 Tax=Heracleum sosnowskyi TaxID=360622 RepID=A0AAD8GY14_9APIA|nr:Gibberellin 2-beta-dioxygenase [Heracleum sosnowskyi]